MPPPTGASGLRAPDSIELAVSYQRVNTFFSDYVNNISRGETFVATNEPLELDTEFNLLLGVPDVEEPLALRARVISVTPPESAGAGVRAGMGIRISFHDADDQARIESLIERLMVDHLGPWHAERLLRRPIATEIIG